MDKSHIDSLILQLEAGDEAFAPVYDRAREVLRTQLGQVGATAIEGLRAETAERESNLQVLKSVMSLLPTHINKRDILFPSMGFEAGTPEEVALLSAKVIYFTPSSRRDNPAHYIIGYEPPKEIVKGRGNGRVLFWRTDDGTENTPKPKSQLIIAEIGHYGMEALTQTMNQKLLTPPGGLDEDYDHELRNYFGLFGTVLRVRSSSIELYPPKFRGDPNDPDDIEKYSHKTLSKDIQLEDSDENRYGPTNQTLIKFDVFNHISKLTAAFGVTKEAQKALFGLRSAEVSHSNLDETQTETV